MPYKDYHLLNDVRVGGTSQVYQVVDRDTSELRVMKVTAFQSIQKSLWLNEIQMLQKFQYLRGVVKMYEFGQVEDTNQEAFGYAVLEWCDDDLLKVPLEAPDWKRVFLFLCEVLSTLHAQGYCYCDLKPENILLKGTGYRLCDFSTCQPSGTQTSLLYGTPHILAPELLEQVATGSEHRYDEKIDSWGLGCLMVELILQEQFDREQLPAQLARVKDEYFQPLLRALLEPRPALRLTLWELQKKLNGLPWSPPTPPEQVQPYLPPLASASPERPEVLEKPDGAPPQLRGSVIKVPAKPTERARLRALLPPFVVVRRRLHRKTSTSDDPAPPPPSGEHSSSPAATPSEPEVHGSRPLGPPKGAVTVGTAVTAVTVGGGGGSGRRGPRARPLARRVRN